MSKKKPTPPPTSPAPQPAPQPSIFQLTKRSDIRPSPNNRKRFDVGNLKELAASIQAVGIAQPILIRPVTPTEAAPEPYEIVAGERRWRASGMADLVEIPTMVREMTDLEADRIRILENLQREDPHALEEAEGYEQLMLQHGYNADQLADEIKKSRSYVYGRLKLCALAKEVRPLFLDNVISASIALLIARIPVPELQMRAVTEITNPKGIYGVAEGEQMSYRRAADHIQSRYMLGLNQAPFDRADSKLLTAAGSCAKCPKRTGNQPVVFADIKSADVCTDPDCFSEKRAAHHARVIVIANKKGIPVIEGDDARKAVEEAKWQRTDLVSAETWIGRMDRNAPHTKNQGNIVDFLKDQLPSPAKLVKLANGESVPLYNRTQVQLLLEQVGACETEAQHAARMAAPKSDAQAQADAKRAAEQAEHAARIKRVDDEEDYRVELYKRIRQRATSGFTVQSLRELTKLALIHGEMALPHDLLGDVYSFDTDTEESVCAHIDASGLPELQLLLIDLLAGQALRCDRWELDAMDQGEPAAFEFVANMARAEGIDPDQVREELYPSPIDAASMSADDVVAFIARCPGRINELVTPIIEDAPHLVKTLDDAAKAAGFKYESNRFVRADEPTSAVDTEPTAQLPDEAPAADMQPDVQSVQPAAEQVAEPKAKQRKPKATALAAGPWPFPKSRDEALSTAGQPAITATETPVAEPATI